MNFISTVSEQWASRPVDQRFLSLDDLHASVSNRRHVSSVYDVALEHVQVEATDLDSQLVVGDGEQVFGPLSHWAFGQLCARAKAPASYLRSLPAELARLPLQWSLEKAVDRARPFPSPHSQVACFQSQPTRKEFILAASRQSPFRP